MRTIACYQLIFQPLNTSVQVFKYVSYSLLGWVVITLSDSNTYILTYLQATVYAAIKQYGSAHVAYPTPPHIPPATTGPHASAPFSWSPPMAIHLDHAGVLIHFSENEKKSCTDAFRGQNTSRSTPHPANLEKENIRNAPRT